MEETLSNSALGVPSPLVVDQIRDGTTQEESDDPGALDEAPPPKKFSLSRLHAYPSGGASRFTGTLHDPLVDAARLGVDVIRVSGTRDIRWGNLTKDDTEVLDAKGEPYTNPGMRLRRDPAKIHESVVSDHNRDRLVPFLLACADNGVKAVLRAIHEGSANNDTVGLPNPDCTTDPKSWDGTRRKDSWAFLWADEHLFEASSPFNSDEGHRFPADEPVSAEGQETCDFHLEAMDISSPYKREYMQLIGENIGELLLNVARELRLTHPDLVLADVVDAIEFLNEANGTKFFLLPGPEDEEGPYDVERSGRYVGATYFRMAWGIRKAFRADPDLVGELPFMLPTLLSYGFDAAAPLSWESLCKFLGFFAQGMILELEAIVDAETVAGAQIRPTYDDLLELVQEIDYHWYHRDHQELDDKGLHIGYLVHEVDEVKRVIGEAFDAVIPLDQEALKGRFHDVKVRVHEGGVSCGESDNIPEPWGEDGELWQAHEVFRRLGGQLASGATQAGWWSWISGVGGDFHGTGLRKEPDLNTYYWRDPVPTVEEGEEPPEPWDPGQNVQRQSWFAYRRMVELLGDRVLSGRMVLPAASSRAGLAEALASQAMCPGVVVFEYELRTNSAGDPRYAYLALVDVNGGSEPALLRATGDTLVEVVPLMPDRMIVNAFNPVNSGTPTDKLPLAEVGYGASVVRELPLTFQVDVADAPLFLYADGPVSWACTSHATDLEMEYDLMDPPPELIQHAGIEQPMVIDHGQLLLDQWHAHGQLDPTDFMPDQNLAQALVLRDGVMVGAETALLQWSWKI